MRDARRAAALSGEDLAAPTGASRQGARQHWRRRIASEVCRSLWSHAPVSIHRAAFAGALLPGRRRLGPGSRRGRRGRKCRYLGVVRHDFGDDGRHFGDRGYDAIGRCYDGEHCGEVSVCFVDDLKVSEHAPAGAGRWLGSELSSDPAVAAWRRANGLAWFDFGLGPAPGNFRHFPGFKKRATGTHGAHFSSQKRPETLIARSPCHPAPPLVQWTLLPRPSRPLRLAEKRLGRRKPCSRWWRLS